MAAAGDSTGAASSTIETAAPATIEATAPATVRLRRTAMVEIVAFVAALVGLDLLFWGGTGYWEVSPHPFWVIVVFVATQYGSREGLAAAVVSSAALFAGGYPEQSLTQDLYSWMFELVQLPLLWLVAAVALGELRMRQVRERDNLRDQVEAARERAGTIATAYESLNEIKSQLEVRVAGQLRTVVSMYEAARAVETMEPAEVLTGALENVRAVINPKKCSIYLLSAGELEAAIQHGWGRRDRLKRMFGPQAPLFREVIERARVVCVADADDEAILDGQGLIAGPLVNPDTGEVRGMIKIEDMGFLDLNVSTIEIFRVLCEWVGAFYANAQRYRRGQIERGVDSETQLFSEAFLPRMERMLTAIGRRAGFPIMAVTVAVDAAGPLESTQRRAVAGALGDAVSSVMRDTDLAFESASNEREFIVVLPLTAARYGEAMSARLAALVTERLPASLTDLSVRCSVRMLCDGEAERPADGRA